MTILRVALDVPLDTLFDYHDGGHSVEVGQRVLVPFGRRRLAGIVLEKTDHSQFPQDRIKPVLEVFQSEPPLSQEILQILRFAASYYHAPIGQAIVSALPAPLRAPRPAPHERRLGYRLTATGRAAGVEALPRQAVLQRKLWLALAQAEALEASALAAISAGWRAAVKPLLAKQWVESVVLDTAEAFAPSQPTPGPVLNPEQQQAVDAVAACLGRFQVALLHGITGSGKTEVYMRLLQTALRESPAQVLVLVPEINLTPQLEHRFHSRFPHERMVSLHSQMNDGERLRNWRLAESGRARIVIGTRLAVFTPMPHLKLIVVDEEHDASYKQQDGMRYSARDIAILRAKQAGIPILLGSATPSLESWHNARCGRYMLLTLGSRAIATARLPEIHTIPAAAGLLRDGFSPLLLEALRQRLARGEQSLLFINRRGYAPVLLCSSCAWTAPCTRCSAHLVVHLRDKRLCCHHCGHEQRIPLQCPRCGNPDLRPTGQGTQRVEATLARLFPQARILRVDRDSTRRKGAMAGMMSDVHGGHVDILVGTQMLAKGHDFPNLTLVGVLDTDSALFSADFRAAERLFAQLMQVAGRAGRAEKPGQVLIQTAFPDHVLFHALKRHDFTEFAASQLEERRMAGLPPYCFQAVLRAEAARLAPVQEFLQEAVQLAHTIAGRVTVYDPVRPTLQRLKGLERAQLLVQAESRKALQKFLDQWMNEVRTLPSAGKVRWSLDVDPLEI
ncbi:MAG: primosomal protein N' [Methylophilaceae bacterium]|nr:primosomal protein N' [Methylophilaceae bacterium]